MGTCMLPKDGESRLWMKLTLIYSLTSYYELASLRS